MCVNRSAPSVQSMSCSSWNVKQRRACPPPRPTELRDRRAVRAEAIAPMHERHARRAIEQLRAPVERRVAAADDHDALPRNSFGIGHHVEDAAPVPRLGARLRQPPRREGADARRDDDRPRRKAVLLGDEHEVPVLLLQPDHALAEMDRLVELRRLLRERFTRSLASTFGKPATSKMYFSG